MSFMNPFAGMGTALPGTSAQLMSTNRGLLNSGNSGFWGGNNGFWGTNDGGWYNPGLLNNSYFNNAGMGFGPGYAPMGYEDLMPRADPLGIYRTYAQHADEVVLGIRDPDTSKHRDNYSIIDTATGQVIFTVRSSPYSMSDKRNLYDMQGNWLFQIRRKGLPFMNDAYIGVDPMNQRTIFSFSNRHGVNGGIGIKFLNTAGMGEQYTIHLGADMYAAAARITDSHGQTVGRINRDAGSMYRHPFNAQSYNLAVAGHVDSALMVAICICVDEKMSRIPGLHH